MPERGETFHEAFIPEGFIPSRKLCHPLPCEMIQNVQKRRKMKGLSREGGGGGYISRKVALSSSFVIQSFWQSQNLPFATFANLPWKNLVLFLGRLTWNLFDPFRFVMSDFGSELCARANCLFFPLPLFSLPFPLSSFPFPLSYLQWLAVALPFGPVPCVPRMLPQRARQPAAVERSSGRIYGRCWCQAVGAPGKGSFSFRRW